MKIPPINIVLNIGAQRPVSPKSKPPARKKGKKKDKENLLMKGLASLKESIEKLPHTGHSGGS